VNDRPTPAELAEAVREFLEREILPILEDDRLRFRTVVASTAWASPSVNSSRTRRFRMPRRSSTGCTRGSRPRLRS
jgi:hypothetical protein